MSRKVIQSSTAADFLENLDALGFDSKTHCKNTKVIVNQRTFTSNPNTVKAFEIITHFLFQLLDARKAGLVFKSIWPIKNITQSKKYRSCAFQWLKDMELGSPIRAVPLRKSYLNDCRGEPLNKIILAFTVHVINKQRSSNSKATGSTKPPSQKLKKVPVITTVQDVPKHRITAKRLTSTRPVSTETIRTKKIRTSLPEDQDSSLSPHTQTPPQSPPTTADQQPPPFAVNFSQVITEDQQLQPLLERTSFAETSCNVSFSSFMKDMKAKHKRQHVSQPTKLDVKVSPLLLEHTSLSETSSIVSTPSFVEDVKVTSIQQPPKLIDISLSTARKSSNVSFSSFVRDMEAKYKYEQVALQHEVDLQGNRGLEEDIRRAVLVERLNVRNRLDQLKAERNQDMCFIAERLEEERDDTQSEIARRIHRPNIIQQKLVELERTMSNDQAVKQWLDSV